MEVQNSLLISEVRGPVLLTGGEFGIEGSLFSTMISILFIIIFLKSRWLRPDTTRSDLWKRYPAGFGLKPRYNQEYFDV